MYYPISIFTLHRKLLYSWYFLFIITFIWYIKVSLLYFALSKIMSSKKLEAYTGKFFCNVLQNIWLIWKYSYRTIIHIITKSSTKYYNFSKSILNFLIIISRIFQKWRSSKHLILPGKYWFYWFLRRSEERRVGKECRL